jgi:hypothetical protein
MEFTVYYSRQPVLNHVFERFKTLLPDILEHSTVQSTVSEVVLIPNDDNCSPAERFWTRESLSGFAFVKTNRTPYTIDVMRACILMVELKMATLTSLSNDYEGEFSWLPELEAVNRYFPLQSYEEQARYFLKKDLAVILDNAPLKDQVEAVQLMKRCLKSVS